MLFQSILGPTPSGAGCAAPLLQQAQAVRGARPQAAARLTLPRAAAALPCHPAGPEGDVESSRGGPHPQGPPEKGWREAACGAAAPQPLPSLRSAAAARSCCGLEPRKNKSPAEQEGKAPAWEKMLLAGTFPAPSLEGELPRSTAPEPQTAPPQPRWLCQRAAEQPAGTEP